MMQLSRTISPCDLIARRCLTRLWSRLTIGPALASSRSLGPAMNRGLLHNVDVDFYATCYKAGYWLRLDSN